MDPRDAGAHHAHPLRGATTRTGRIACDPQTVPCPNGYAMTDPAAWELIAERLEDPKQRLETTVLRKPKGAKAYVMKIRLPHLPARIDAKFEFVVPASGQKICGRSFHLEDPR